MATVFVPGVAQTVLSGTIGSNPFAVVHHWQFGSLTGAWNATDIDTLALTCLTACGTALKTQSGNNVSWTQCAAVDLSNSAGLSAVHVTPVTIGTLPNSLEPASLCAVTKNVIGARYRGGHPRTFWPLNVANNMSDESHWGPTPVSTIQTAVNNWFAAVETAAYTVSGAALQNVIVRYQYTYTNDTVHHKWLKEKQPPATVFPCSQHIVQAQVGTQRRRLVH